MTRSIPATCVLSALLSATLAGCGDGTSAPGFDTASSPVQRIVDPQVPTADATTLASDNAAFAFDVYKQLVLTNTNLVFSPASISIALAMTYAGAAGTTATEMAQTLHFSLPPDRLHPAFNALDQALASRGQGYSGADGGPMQVNIVNALWAEKTYTFRSDFLDTLAANYGAGVNLLDFINAPEPSRVTINTG
jgi:serpin B